ncbi:MAG: amidase family protein, partial [Deltaproteobacteria bacterium]
GDVPVALSALGAPMRKHEPLEKPVFGLCRTEAWDRAEPTTRAAVEAAAARLELAGAQVREIVLGAPFAGLIETQIAIMGAEAAASLRRELDDRPYDLSPKLREFLEAGRAVTPERLRAAHFQADTCRRELEGLFKGVDALLTPASVGEAPVGLESTGDPLFNRIWTLLGNPCVSLPVLQGPAGMPLGLQLIGPRGRDETLLAAAEYVMREFAA